MPKLSIEKEDINSVYLRAILTNSQFVILSELLNCLKNDKSIIVLNGKKYVYKRLRDWMQLEVQSSDGTSKKLAMPTVYRAFLGLLEMGFVSSYKLKQVRCFCINEEKILEEIDKISGGYFHE